MNSSMVDESFIPVAVSVDEAFIHVQFSGGSKIAVAVANFPRLGNAQPAQRVRWQLNGRGYGIHWPDVDEDISVPGLRRMAEVQVKHVA